MGALAATVAGAAVLALGATAAPPKRAYTPFGTAAAKAIVVVPADLPAGWKRQAASTGGGSITCKSFDPDQSDLTTIGRAESSFASADGLETVSSIAAIFRSAAQGSTSWSRLVRPGMLTCLASIFQKGATSGTTTTTIVSKGRLPLSLPGRRKAGYRIVADVATNGQHVKAYVDLILQGGGSADTVMLVTGILQPPSAALERRLAAAVAGRLPSS